MSMLPRDMQATNALDQPLSWHLERVPACWQPALTQPEARAALQTLATFVDQRIADGAQIFPRHPFRALHHLAPDDVKVVILGQDPYHGPGQAHGLAFSVPHQCPRPPSLRNILAELTRDYPDELFSGNHDLTPWADQGVLLLNAVLTVEQAKPASHANKGWEAVTDALLSQVAATPSPKVFMLWGAYAQRKRALVEAGARGPLHVLTANHPSPLSARRPPVPFVGCGHFRQANQWLQKHGVDPIDWLAL